MSWNLYHKTMFLRKKIEMQISEQIDHTVILSILTSHFFPKNYEYLLDYIFFDFKYLPYVHETNKLIISLILERETVIRWLKQFLSLQSVGLRASQTNLTRVLSETRKTILKNGFVQNRTFWIWTEVKMGDFNFSSPGKLLQNLFRL